MRQCVFLLDVGFVIAYIIDVRGIQSDVFSSTIVDSFTSAGQIEVKPIWWCQ